MEIEIVKADGTREPFKREKLETSLRRAGAQEDIVQRVIDAIETELEPGMHTNRIYEQAFRILKETEDRLSAARYSTKQALFDLGPTGYPFETFVKELLVAEGWKYAKTQQRIDGVCTWHEVDVVACRDPKEKNCLGVEVKFHNQKGTKGDVTEVMYVQARFTDIIETGGKITQGCLITNTKFTSQGKEYGQCVGLDLIGWNCPADDPLEERIARTGVRPITMMPSLSKKECKELLEKDIVLCRTLLENLEALQAIGIAEERIPKIKEDAQLLCKPDTAAL